MGAETRSEVTIEVRMSLETAQSLATREASRLAKLNPGRTDLPSESPGVAVLNVLGLYAANGRV